MKTLIGVVSFGGIGFLEMFLRSVQETLSKCADILVIVAKPGDEEMKNFLALRNFRFIAHEENKGFAASINDLYDAAFVNGDYDNLIICGNDVVLMPGAIDAMIETAASTDWEMVCGSEFNSRFLVNTYPEAAQYFHGENLVFHDFNARPWELHKDFRNGIEPNTLKDVRNFTLFKRGVFEKVGYDDVNFWPNGYFADNDYALRCHKTGVRACGLKEASFYHFWSRTIFQGPEREHSKYFARNSGFFVHKWGGPVNGERYDLPFHGDEYPLASDIRLPGTLKIASRSDEERIINYWRHL